MYDGELVIVEGEVQLLQQLNFGSGMLPCALIISGNDQGLFRVQNNGSFCCKQTLGCTSIAVESLQIVCEDARDSISVFTHEGSFLSVLNSTISGCNSYTFGGVIHSYDYASIEVRNCSFVRVQSSGFGGAISAASSTVFVTGTNFFSCFSVLGGGAIWAAQDATYDPLDLADSVLIVESSVFKSCSTGGTGGAIMATSDCSTSTRAVTIKVVSTEFVECDAVEGGGAISSSGSLVTVEVIRSLFENNRGASGGALLSSNNAQANASYTLFMNNSADMDGGAVRLTNSSFTSLGSSFTNNTAVSGGGGAVFWQGSQEPDIYAWCASGSWGSQAGCKDSHCTFGCVLCDIGTFQSGEGASTCTACEAGTYSNVSGGSVCFACLVGSYSTSAGGKDSSSCSWCLPGTYSESGASTCTACEAGTYSDVPGGSVCLACSVGSYSGATESSSCSQCEAGSFAQVKYFTITYASLTWADAETACMSSGGHLATINSDAENQEVLDFILNQQENSNVQGLDYWIGYHYDVKAASWSWADGSPPMYTHWGEKNPKNGTGQYYCADFPSYNNYYSTNYWPFYSENASAAGGIGTLSSPAGAWYNYDCNNSDGWMNGFVCEQFQGTGLSSCTACPTGTYSTVHGARNASACILCELGTYSKAGASQCLLCNTGDCSAFGGSVIDSRSDPASVRQLNPRKRPSPSGKSRYYVSTPTTETGRRNSTSNLPLSARNLAIYKRGYNQRQTKSLAFDPITNVHLRMESPRVDSSNSAERRSDVCGPGNKAVYGPCIATPFKALEVSGLPSNQTPAFSGLMFNCTVVKRDFYDQIISSDSSSILQIQTATDDRLRTDSSVLISGTFTVSLTYGKASFYVAVHPTFAQINQEFAILSSQPQVYLKGIDADTLSEMNSGIYSVVLVQGRAVCPSGYILTLDSSNKGSCSECGPGSYSISPLAGLTADQPSCLSCPVKADCQGGDKVLFSLGTWIQSGGLYMLVGCPAGHQLVNSVDGVFSQEAQNCLACSADQYILDSNNSIFSCQTCPTGAVCDGSELQGKVPGSVWDADMVTGLYRLESCPFGYLAQISSQQSQQCSLWSATTFVTITATLPLTEEQFDASVQTRFLAAVASVASVNPDQVMIASVTQVAQSRRSDESAQVTTYAAANNVTAAAAMESRLASPALNARLVANGLPSISHVSVVVVNGAVVAASTPLAITIGASVGGLLVLVAGLAGGSVLLNQVRRQAAYKAFLVAFGKAKTGDEATPDILPLALRKEFVGVRVAGKGAFGCVVEAKVKGHAKPGDAMPSKKDLRTGTRTGVEWNQMPGSSMHQLQEKSVAIKIIVPSKGGFDERETRQISREAKILDLFSMQRCEHAVHLAGIRSVRIQPEVCTFIMELLTGDNLETVLRQAPLNDTECIRVSRAVLAALKVMHAEGLVHRDIKPANIVRCACQDKDDAGGRGNGTGWGKGLEAEAAVLWRYKLIDFGTALGVDEKLAREEMMTVANSRHMGAGTPPYMSPEMFTEPELAKYPTDLWSLGVTLFELGTGCLPFEADNEIMLGIVIASMLDEKAPNMLDRLAENRRAVFDHNLVKVVARALEKRVADRYQSADEMHDDVYRCLIHRGEAVYSVFISYRVASEAPLAHLLFDELNHSVTPAGHRVTVYWDAQRLVKGEDWEMGFSNALLNSLCIFPLLSYGSTAPFAELPDSELVAKGWDERPVCRPRLQGSDLDAEDNVLKELLIASILLERRNAPDREETEKGLLQMAYPILIGRQQPEGHPGYPGMGDFFQVQAGGGKYPSRPSPPTARAASRFLAEKALVPDHVRRGAEARSVESVVKGLTALQGCQLWAHSPDLREVDLTKEQAALFRQGCTGPPVDLGGIVLTPQQRDLCRGGFDMQQLRMLKAQVRAKKANFHEVIDRAIAASKGCVLPPRAASSKATGVSQLQLHDEILGPRRGLPAARSESTALAGREPAAAGLAVEAGPVVISATVVMAEAVT